MTDPVAWRITYKRFDGYIAVHYHGHNAIADYRQIDPDAVSEPLYEASAIEAAKEECARLCDEMVLYTGYDCAKAIRESIKDV